MDLEPYALTHAASASITTGTSSPPRNDKGKARANDAEGEEGNAQTSVDHGDAETPLPTIEEDVKQLVQGVSSWWTGFSRKSQAQFAQAQQHIASQGGIVSFAKKEASRLEAQLEETRRKAKEKREEEEEEEWRRRKRQEKSILEDKQTQQRQAIEHQDEDQQTTPKSMPFSNSLPQSTSLEIHQREAEGGEGIFDADELTATGDGDSAKMTAQQGPPSSASQSPFALDTSLFSRLQTLSSDPRVASIQQDLASRLSSSFSVLSNSISSATASSTNDASSSKDGSGSSRENQPSTISTTASTTLSSTLQEISSSLAKISGPEAKAYAQKYLKASEELVGKMGEEVKGVVGELVKVVPPQSNEVQSIQSASAVDPTVPSPASAFASTERRSALKQPSEVSSDFSSWDLTDAPHKTSGEHAIGGGGAGVGGSGTRAGSGTTTPSAFSSMSGDHQPAAEALVDQEGNKSKAMGLSGEVGKENQAQASRKEATPSAAAKSGGTEKEASDDQDARGDDSGEDSDWD